MNKLLKPIIPDNIKRIQHIIDNNIYGFSMERTNVIGLILLLKEGFFEKLNLDFINLKAETIKPLIGETTPFIEKIKLHLNIQQLG